MVDILAGWYYCGVDCNPYYFHASDKGSTFQPGEKPQERVVNIILKIMIRNYLKVAVRNIIRYKGYSAINIAGLSIGIAASLLLFLVIRYEYSYDTFQKEYNNIYRVVTVDKPKGG